MLSCIVKPSLVLWKIATFKDQRHKRGILADAPAPHFTAFELDTNFGGYVWIVSLARACVSMMAEDVGVVQGLSAKYHIVSLSRTTSFPC